MLLAQIALQTQNHVIHVMAMTKIGQVSQGVWMRLPSYICHAACSGSTTGTDMCYP